MITDVPRLTVLKQILSKIKELLARARKWNAHTEFPSGRGLYTSVPVWKPWRDF